MGKFRSMQSTSKKKDQTDAPYATKIANMLNDAVRAKSSLLEEECSICLDPINIHDSVVTPCFHIFCKDCLVGVLRERPSGTQNNNESKFNNSNNKNPVLRCPNGLCPVCTEEIDSSKILRISESDGTIQTSYLLDSLKSSECVAMKQEDGAARQALETAVLGSSSSKLTAILQELDNVWKEDPGSKVLIFSQFLGFLDLMEQSLKSNTIPFSRLDGKLSLKERMAVLQEFGTEKPSIVNNDSESAAASASNRVGSVLLISMKAGGVGLNLVAARTVFISDPWWNAAVEDQCVDRIHRIGQTADKVRVRKFYVANSVEERIVELQKRKKNVAAEVLGDTGATGTGESSARPSLEDFQILFRDARVD
jgi:SNF2 family DNA or RNA helicase